MITHENFNEVIDLIRLKDKLRLLNSSKEYTVIYLNIFNVGATVDIKLTDNYIKYQYVSNNGDCILSTDEIEETIKTKSNFRTQLHKEINILKRAIKQHDNNRIFNNKYYYLKKQAKKLNLILLDLIEYYS